MEVELRDDTHAKAPGEEHLGIATVIFAESEAHDAAFVLRVADDRMFSANTGSRNGLALAVSVASAALSARVVVHGIRGHPPAALASEPATALWCQAVGVPMPSSDPSRLHALS
jgi:hypothetical protein